MQRQILQIGAPILTQVCEIVDPSTDESAQIRQDLFDTVMINPDGSAGLAAPQIGYLKAICICRRTDLEEKSKHVSEKDLWLYMHNPVIVKKSSTKSIFWEGCLSIGEGKKQLFSPVARSAEVSIEYLDNTGKKQLIDASGFFAHVVQHEVDHLNGKLFLSYVTNPKDIWLSGDLDTYLKKHGDYPAPN